MSGAGLKVLIAADARSFHTERFAAELRAQGCDVRVASLESGPMDHIALERKAPISTIAYAMAAGPLQRLIDSFEPDIVNPHYAAGYGFLVSRLEPQNAPVILHVWGSDILRVPQRSALGRAKVLRGLNAADMVVADSNYLADAVAALGTSTPVQTIPWGIERMYLADHRTSYAVGRPLRIIVPRLHEPIYNNLFVVEALQEEIGDGALRLTFPAFGSEYEDFRQAASALVGDRIEYYERLPRERFVELMASHDVYLSAARSDSSPVTLIEAMALGLIPVVGDIRGVDEWLTEDAGYRFTIDAPDTLRKTIAGLIDAGDDHATMRQRNLEQVKLRGVFEDNMRRQVELMRDLIERKGRA